MSHGRIHCVFLDLIQFPVHSSGRSRSGTQVCDFVSHHALYFPYLVLWLSQILQLPKLCTLLQLYVTSLTNHFIIK